MIKGSLGIYEADSSYWRMKNSDKFKSVICNAYFRPIFYLFEKLLEKSIQKSPALSGPIENPFAASIVVLLVVCLESFLTSLKSKGKIYERIQKQYSKFKNTEKLKEIFVLRDLIVHNHIWDIEFNQENMALISVQLEEGFGDPKFKECIDRQTKKTKLLGLHIIPTSVDRDDACIVLKTVIQSLLFLEEKSKRKLVYISDQHYCFRGKLKTINTIMQEIIV